MHPPDSQRYLWSRGRRHQRICKWSSSPRKISDRRFFICSHARSVVQSVLSLKTKPASRSKLQNGFPIDIFWIPAHSSNEGKAHRFFFLHNRPETFRFNQQIGLNRTDIIISKSARTDMGVDIIYPPPPQNRKYISMRRSIKKGKMFVTFDSKKSEKLTAKWNEQSLKTSKHKVDPKSAIKPRPHQQWRGAGRLIFLWYAAAAAIDRWPHRPSAWPIQRPRPGAAASLSASLSPSSLATPPVEDQPASERDLYFFFRHRYHHRLSIKKR